MDTPTDKTFEILVVDDDPDIREVLRLLLEGEGYATREASCGQEALERLDERVHLVLLDALMPGESGFDVCARIRERYDVMIMFLTAKAQEMDRVRGLRCGGDDYLAKPFSPAELSARVGALLRRYHSHARNNSVIYERGGVRVDISRGEVTRGGVRVTLTDIEYRVLAYLAGRRGETIDARTLYEAVWREPYLLASAGTIMVHIGNLRRKLEDDPKHPSILKTVWGKGYCVE
ncbi:MAG: response regulator transcription factor [Oscillospiraceae bacterium]|jgi:DNA-binding response OmpR family regulator|nr:response regulator transcription factor [Oscillospiraceae bacterium]